jgi:hypothetical protein
LPQCIGDLVDAAVGEERCVDIVGEPAQVEVPVVVGGNDGLLVSGLADPHQAHPTISAFPM